MIKVIPVPRDLRDPKVFRAKKETKERRGPLGQLGQLVQRVQSEIQAHKERRGQTELRERRALFLVLQVQGARKGFQGRLWLERQARRDLRARKGLLVVEEEHLQYN